MKTEIRTLETVAAKGRLLGLDMVYHCASGHLGGSFSAMDILTVLYFEVMNVDPKNPADPEDGQESVSGLYSFRRWRGGGRTGLGSFPQRSQIQIGQPLRGH